MCKKSPIHAHTRNVDIFLYQLGRPENVLKMAQAYRKNNNELQGGPAEVLRNLNLLSFAKQYLESNDEKFHHV